MRKFSCFMGVLVALALSFSATAAEYRWSKVGVDPCNPKVGCTLAWALPQTSWPKEVQSRFLVAVRMTSRTFTVRAGWRGWMTWGRYAPKFRADTIAAWTNGRGEVSRHWFVDYGGVRYNLIKVRACGNWGGFKSQPEPAPPPPMNLGVLPLVACP